MAEIKSSMEMVLERAARMVGDFEGADEGSDEILKQGMRAAAVFMRGEGSGLAGEVALRPDNERVDFLKGAAKTLLRSILLPRDDEQLKVAEIAMNGLVQLGQGSSELLAVLGDLKKILGQCLQHRVQAREQLEAAFAQQMAMMEGELAQKTGMNMKLKPTQHPKFNEEWQRVLNELNTQYGRAIDQHKELVENFLSGL